MLWFHRHEFDPEKWKVVGEYDVGPRGSTDITYRLWIYSNTCKKCGELVFRKETTFR